ncbi:MAG: hypothetical protein Q4C47_08270, partial [Planctomycetia bacterium]|nr:hypothetical protein [Planctomycetia bacterium]
MKRFLGKTSWLAVVTALCFAGTVQAQGPDGPEAGGPPPEEPGVDRPEFARPGSGGPMGRRFGGPGFGGPAGGMELTPEQWDAFRAIHEEYQPKMKELQEEFAAKMKSLHEEMTAKTEEILTPEQKEKVEAWKAKRSERDGEQGPGFGKGFGPGPGFGMGFGPGQG